MDLITLSREKLFDISDMEIGTNPANGFENTQWRKNYLISVKWKKGQLQWMQHLLHPFLQSSSVETEIDQKRESNFVILFFVQRKIDR